MVKLHPPCLAANEINSLLRPSDDIWIWVNISSCNDLLPDGNRPLPEPTLTCHQLSPAAFTWWQVLLEMLKSSLTKIFRKLHNSHQCHISQETSCRRQCILCEVSAMPPGLAFSKNHYLPDFNNFEILRFVYMKLRGKICSNQLVWLAVLLARAAVQWETASPGHMYTRPDIILIELHTMQTVTLVSNEIRSNNLFLAHAW